MNENSPTSLDAAELYLNRELSLLEFNRRVLAQAADPRMPLLERLRFLTIVSSNLDEFFEVRVGLLKQRIELGLAMNSADQLTAPQLMRRISGICHQLVDEQYRLLNAVLLPELAGCGVHLIRRSRWTDAQRDWVRDYFHTQVQPLLTPVGLDPSHPFPVVQNKALNFIVTLEGQDAFERDANVAILRVPRSVPRVIQLPGEGDAFTLISSVIHANVAALFPGMQVTGCYQFRVTRNSNMWVDEDDIDDLLVALKGELHGRNYGSEVRLEVAESCPQSVAEFLLTKHQLGVGDLYQVNGPVNLHRLGGLVNSCDREELKFPPFTPGIPERLGPKQDLLATLRARDVLLYHPYHSYNPVVDLLWRAADDPAVLAIKMTLYRVGGTSPITEALIAAARAGKDVTVVVELRARFDEARNIDVATQLIEAGANVVYGVVGYKCHAKLLMLVRREGEALRRYVHVGTGNYHIRNAKLYTDYSLLTADPTIGRDVHMVFQELTGLGEVPTMGKLLHSPFTLLSTVLELVEAEITAAQAGKPARIVAKMNSLTERSVIQGLYRASQAGVQVDLIVRGICCLRPGLPGVSENIRVRSLVGRFLEHCRIWQFHAGGDDAIFITSADWMDRNLYRRVEVACPVSGDELQAQVDANLQLFLDDTRLAWTLGSDGTYVRVDEAGTLSAQSELMRRHGDHGGNKPPANLELTLDSGLKPV